MSRLKCTESPCMKIPRKTLRVARRSNCLTWVGSSHNLDTSQQNVPRQDEDKGDGLLRGQCRTASVCQNNERAVWFWPHFRVWLQTFFSDTYFTVFASWWKWGQRTPLNLQMLYMQPILSIQQISAMRTLTDGAPRIFSCNRVLLSEGTYNSHRWQCFGK